MKLPETPIPIIEIPERNGIRIFVKREDLIHPKISGNKYWKLFYNINHFLESIPQNPLLITFGGAFSNHIAAVAALGKDLEIPTLGIIRGEELIEKWKDNPTLHLAFQDGMNFRFVSRENYRDKETITQLLQKEFPNALIIPEGGTNKRAVEGVKHMLNDLTKDFNYLCTAVGTGGTVSGISKFAEDHQNVIGFKVVSDSSLENRVAELSERQNFELIDAHFDGYGKISNELIRFINNFHEETGIPLDPVYTGKMMMKFFELIDNGYFPEGSKVLAFHTGGLQGIKGANEMLRQQNRDLINF